MVRRQLRHLSLPCRILMAERLQARRLQAGRLQAGRLQAGRLQAGRLLAGDLSTQATRREKLDGARAGPGSIYKPKHKPKPTPKCVPALAGPAL